MKTEDLRKKRLPFVLRYPAHNLCVGIKAVKINFISPLCKKGVREDFYYKNSRGIALPFFLFCSSGDLSFFGKTYLLRVNKEGVVLLEVSIDSEGRVIETQVIKSAGVDLDNAAVEAIKNSIFSPALSGDKAVAVKIRIPFRFELR